MKFFEVVPVVFDGVGIQRNVKLDGFPGVYRWEIPASEFQKAVEAAKNISSPCFAFFVDETGKKYIVSKMMKMCKRALIFNAAPVPNGAYFGYVRNIWRNPLTEFCHTERFSYAVGEVLE